MTKYRIYATYVENGVTQTCDRSYALGSEMNATYDTREEAESVADDFRCDVGDVVNATVEYHIEEVEEESKRYQIYVDRGNGPELDGCWGSEEASFDDPDEAKSACRSLLRDYQDVAWLVIDEQESEVVYRVEISGESI